MHGATIKTTLFTFDIKLQQNAIPNGIYGTKNFCHQQIIGI